MGGSHKPGKKKNGENSLRSRVGGFEEKNLMS